MKLIYSLLVLLLGISPWAAHAEVVYSTIMCPQSVAVNANSFVPPAIILSQIGGSGDVISAPYASGIPYGRGEYINHSNTPLILQLKSATCFNNRPNCVYERPANATYHGTKGPGYQADSSVCVSCSLKPDQTFLCGRDG